MRGLVAESLHARQRLLSVVFPGSRVRHDLSLRELPHGLSKGGHSVRLGYSCAPKWWKAVLTVMTIMPKHDTTAQQTGGVVRLSVSVDAVDYAELKEVAKEKRVSIA